MAQSLILIYTGNGKGKTSACVGQAIRAMGQGLRLAFVQFMKRDDQAGEQKMLRDLLAEKFFAGGEGFFRHEEDRSKHRAATLETLNWAKQQVQHVDMLILDESLYALHAGLLMQEEVEEIIISARESNTHLIFSGRNAPEWLVQVAHLVTEMKEVKHPWQQGIKASKGIEY